MAWNPSLFELHFMRLSTQPHMNANEVGVVEKFQTCVTEILSIVFSISVERGFDI